MDATTFAAMRLAQQRFADLERENARLVAIAERRAAARSATPAPAPLAPALDPGIAGEATGFALAGPSS